MSWMDELRVRAPSLREQWRSARDLDVEKRAAFVGLRLVQFVAYGLGWCVGYRSHPEFTEAAENPPPG